MTGEAAHLRDGLGGRQGVRPRLGMKDRATDGEPPLTRPPLSMKDEYHRIYETDLGVNLAGRSRRIGRRLISLTQADRFSHESGNLFSTPCSPPARVFSSRASCNATCLATSSRNSYKLHDHDEVHVPVPR